MKDNLARLVPAVERELRDAEQRNARKEAEQQVVAVLGQVESREPVASQFTLYLDTIQDPGNFGTIIRIADWQALCDYLSPIPVPIYQE